MTSPSRDAPGRFDAVVLAISAHAEARVLGLSLVERGRRVASRIGARRIFIVRSPTSAAELPAWLADGGGVDVLVVRAGDQVVHMPLFEPLLAGTSARRIAIDSAGAYAGALWASGDAVDEVVAAIVAAPAEGDRDLVRRWQAERRAESIVHGPIARHPATTRRERAAAEQMLLELLVKSEDGPVTRYIYRPVSRPLTRLFARTPITPNQISILVGIIGMFGCWLTARPGQSSLIFGAMLVLFAGFLDGCDGEVARVRLTSSKFGAWIDTVVDELTTTVYFVAIGYHTYALIPRSWVAATIAIGAAAYLITIFVIYHFLIVVSKTGNSQHYVTRLDLVEDPVLGWGLRPPAAATSTLPPWIRTLGHALAQVVRRDFINLGSCALALADGYLVIYLGMLAGGVVTAAILIPSHLRLRGQLRELRRRGLAPRLLPALR